MKKIEDVDGGLDLRYNIYGLGTLRVNLKFSQFSPDRRATKPSRQFVRVVAFELHLFCTACHGVLRLREGYFRVDFGQAGGRA